MSGSRFKMELTRQLTHFIQRKIKLLEGVGGHYRETDQTLTGLNGGRNNRIDEHTRFLHGGGKSKGVHCVTHEHGDNRGFTGAGIEADVLQPFSQVIGVAPEQITALGFGENDFERGDDGGDGGRRRAGGKDQSAAVMLQEMDNVLRRGDEPADGRKRL